MLRISRFIVRGQPVLRHGNQFVQSSDMQWHSVLLLDFQPRVHLPHGHHNLRLDLSALQRRHLLHQLRLQRRGKLQRGCQHNRLLREHLLPLGPNLQHRHARMRCLQGRGRFLLLRRGLLRQHAILHRRGMHRHRAGMHRAA